MFMKSLARYKTICIMFVYPSTHFIFETTEWNLMKFCVRGLNLYLSSDINVGCTSFLGKCSSYKKINTKAKYVYLHFSRCAL